MKRFESDLCRKTDSYFSYVIIMKRNLLTFTLVLMNPFIWTLFGCHQQSAPVTLRETVIESDVEVVQTPEHQETTPKQTLQTDNSLPRISFEKTVCDLGEVGQDTKNTCEFKFTNTGHSLLKIGNIKRTCGCTVFELDKKEYAPGEAGTIKVTYTAGKSTALSEKHIYVPSNDKDNPNVKLTIKASVVQLVEVTPQKLELSLRKENAGISEITLKSRDNKPFSIKGFQSTNHNSITADFDPNFSASEFVLHPKVDIEKLKAGSNGLIQIQLTHPQCPSVQIPYELLPDFKATPPMVHLFGVNPQEAVTREISIVSSYGEDFEVESTSSKNSYVKVLSQEKVGDGFKFTVQVTPPVASGVSFFSDTFYVNIKGKDKLAIDCRGFYTKPAAYSKGSEGAITASPRFRIEPQVVKVRDTEPGRTVTAEVLVLSTGNEEFQIESTSSQKGLVDLVSQEKEGNRYKLELKITPPPSEHRLEVFSDVLYVTIKSSGNDSEVTKLLIPCRGSYLRKRAS